MEMSTTFAIFCLLFGSIHAHERVVRGGVRRFEMQVGDNYYQNCGGKDVKIRLIDSRNEVCETSVSDPFRKNQVVYWANYRAGTCKHNMIIDSSTKLQIHAGAWDTFCPRKIVLYTTTGQRLVSLMSKSEYSPYDNNLDHSIGTEGESTIKHITLKIRNENCGENIWYRSPYSSSPAYGCGGKNIKVKITTGNNICYTKVKPLISKNHFASWIGDDLGDCKNQRIEASRVGIETENTHDKFAVELMQIMMSDNDDTLYRVLNLQHYTNGPYFNSNGSPVRFSLQKLWPPPGGVPQRTRPLVCPRPEEDACPLNEMAAYKVNSNRNMNCVPECDRVTNTRYSTNPGVTDGTGFRCMRTEYTSSQFGYCCRTNIRSETIPYCGNVPGGNMQTEEQFLEETDLQCPQVGCPVASVKEYYDPNPNNVFLECEPECDFVNGPANSTNSGFYCATTRRTRRETKFCCNVQGAATNLPTCQSSENNQGNEANHGNGVNQGNGINHESGVNHGYGLNHGNGVNHESGVNYGYGVNHGNGANHGSGVNHGYGINRRNALNNGGSMSNQNRFRW